ncbi:MAG: NAD(P)-dependent oxidoreductase [Acetanaerobacterium sp.]
MKIAICDYKEPLNRDINREITFFKQGLGEDTEVVVYEHNGEEQSLIDAIHDADGILTSYLEFPASVINSAPKLKVISIEATGYNFVDAEAATKKGVAVTVIGEYCTQEVSEHVMALLLSVSRNLKHYQYQIEQMHRFDYNDIHGMQRLEGQTMGIMGLGKIGRAVAQRAAGFGIKVLAYSPTCPPEAAAKAGALLVSEDEIYEKCDIISLNMRLTPENHGILNARAFSKMKRKPIILNVSRGDLIVEEELVKALDNGTVRGAGLDVLIRETHEETLSTPLAGRENVVITPHSAFYSDTSLYECQRIASMNVVHVLKGEKEKTFRMVNDV